MLNRILPHVGAILVFLIVCAFYFSPQLKGLVVQQGDVTQYRGMSQEIRDFKEKTGETTLWTNAMFGGMPTYQINTVHAGNNLKYVDRVNRLFIHHPIGRYFAAMVGFYILLTVLGVNPWLSVAGAIAFGFSTNNFLLYEAGHMTKLQTVSYFPLMIAGMLLAFRKRYLLGGILFALGLGLSIWSNHIQMNYYLFLTLLIFGVAQLVSDVKKGALMDFLKGAGVLVIAGLVALGSAASNLWVTYEYSKDTMRGEPILTAEPGDAGSQSSSETDGLAWDYAMQWSNGTIDLFSSFIPGVAGGGSQEKLGSSSPLKKDPTWRQIGNYGPLYWGELPFTSGPIYFGALVFLFFLIGLFVVDGPIKWWIGLGTLLTFMLSMGKNLEMINEFFFYYVPLFNKFRTPNSVLTVTSFLMPLLGFLAIGKIAAGEVTKKRALNALYISGGICAAICLFFWLLGPSFYDFSSPGDGRYEQAGLSLGPLYDARKALMSSDALRTLALVLLGGGLLWVFLQEKINKNLLFAGIALLVLFDLVTVGKRYMDSSNFVAKRNYDNAIPRTSADDQILQDKDPNFRVLDLSTSTFQSSRASYYHKSLGGYHAAKLQRYQDIIDRHLTQGNQKVVDMLNTKYFIGEQDRQTVAQRNPGALGNAWFVSNIVEVATPNAEIDALNTFEPGEDAVVHQEFKSYLEGLSLNKGGNIQLTDYQPNHLTYQSSAPSEQLAVFSEIWYGPNKGWQAYIDGNPVEHIRANYVLRAMRIPAGEHKIEFVFDPKNYARGKMVSMFFSSLILLSLVGFVGYRSYTWYQNAQSEPTPQKPAPKPTEKPNPRNRKGKKGKKR